MKNFVLVPALALFLAGPAPAQEGDALSRGLGLLEEGSRLLMQGIIEELGPAWQDLMDVIDNLSAYEPPEVLPNGDIIIRRKVPLVPPDGADREI